MWTTLLSLTLWSATLAPSAFLDTRSLIEQALDEKPQITLENIKLSDAIDKLTDQTGVKILMSDTVMSFLPHGADTKISKVEITNIPLRRGLAELFNPLGMTFTVEDDHVAILPKEPLFLLGRPATWDELDLLQRLGTMKPASEASVLEKLQPLIQFRVFSRDPWGDLSGAMRTVGAASADEALTLACGSLGWAWRLSGDKIVVTTQEEQIRASLQRRITLRSNSRPLFETLTQISEKANVPIRIDGADIAPRIYSLNVSDAPAEQVLAKIAAETGLGYLVDPGGVVFYSANRGPAQPSANDPNQNAPPTTDANPRPRVMVKVVQDIGNGKTVEWLFWENELPEDIRQQREEIKQLAFDELRRAKEGGK